MNIFSRIKGRIVALINSRLERQEALNAEKPIPQPKPRHTFRFRPNTGRPIFGPAMIPDGTFHHVSRQACRAMLRAIQFQNVSARAPLASRRERRRVASLFARMEYRRMMSDRVNAIPDEAELIYHRMTREELGVSA